MVKRSKGWICARHNLTTQQPYLTLSISSDNSLFRWPTLALMALATLRLYFFCSSIRRSSEHFCLCCRPPTWRPISTQQPGLRVPANKKVFSFPFTPSSLLVLDWLDSETFGVHNSLVSHGHLWLQLNPFKHHITYCLVPFILHI